MWLRLRQIALVAPELEPAVDELRALFGIEVCFRDPGVAHFGLVNALLPVGNQFIEIVAPTRDGTAGGRYLERRGGAGGYMVITQCDDHAPRQATRRTTRRTHRQSVRNARIPQHADAPEGHRRLVLRNRPTARRRRARSRWAVGAGGRRRLEESQATRDASRGFRPRRYKPTTRQHVAARWAEIAELPVRAGKIPTIELDNATLRFVPITDGRPEGLGGLDIITHDRDAILDTAQARNIPIDGNQIYACGMRFNLL